MKRIIKLLSLTLIGFISLFLYVGNVNAADYVGSSESRPNGSRGNRTQLMECHYSVKDVTSKSFTLKVFVWQDKSTNEIYLDHDFWSWDFKLEMNLAPFKSNCKWVCPNIAYYEDDKNFLTLKTFDLVKNTELKANGGLYNGVNGRSYYGQGNKIPGCVEEPDDPVEEPDCVVDDHKFEFCQSKGVIEVMRIGYYAINIIKIVVPLLIIIFGVIDFAKAVIASDDDAIKKSAKGFAIRLIAGVVIFFIPTIINFVVNLVPNNNDDFPGCSGCLFDGDCKYYSEVDCKVHTVGEE